ncbi:NADP-dependent malic enzyme [Enterococcus dongliensis]|uniref:NADP-dependent malic enzyme n=1 Tax=Enterococcus dongliensis TaxID=2559925 RepID=A0AAP5NIT1_9ENTE|nr:NADP-dependent malic enzyme [Enterococcus dongliensis]MDT2596662.1 NADP-dependent malic enzyme [Enterococcus dongliensis]MDT2604189.1 NADP-dependent malic enzyme [Enterococcus dongliensis]MDT2634619.1 NADP-dependent malic enzyme [Enterococcus dongliensis]MDT2637557.1 NADP-dependent malic enzyme [Enterococcus dongliensis]MDT2642637.1 NADP-dependent malic enzyme [Enterococcus dongliensis]
MTIYEEALTAHRNWRGKIEVMSKINVLSKEDLSLAYTPGVAEPCRKIAENNELAYDYTWKGNSVAVVTDGTAVLGLGDIGPAAALPVMEGKALLFKEFAGIDAVPICLDTTDPQEIIQIVKALAPTFGGINLEDISAPRCVEIERALIEALDIPVFHDDQHGTAVVVTAALINALKLVKKIPQNLKVVVSGTGAAGSAIIKMLIDLGVKKIIAFNKEGALHQTMENATFVEKEILEVITPKDFTGTMAEAFVGADVFIGVSAPNLVTKEMVATMNEGSIVFPMANPEPEITYHEALAGGAAVVGTGRSDYPNQINNVLAFPGLFRGAFAAEAKKITPGMQLACAHAIADTIPYSELNSGYVIPSAFDENVVDLITLKVAEAARKDGVTR